MRKIIRSCLVAFLFAFLAIPSYSPAAQGWGRITGSYGLTAGEVISTGNAVFTASDGMAYLADSDVFSEINVTGIAQKTSSTGNSVGIVTDGITNGLTSLTIGAPVYLSTTPGALTQTKPAINPVPLGIALSATEYKIDVNQPPELNGYVFSFADNNLTTAQSDVALNNAGSSTVTEIEMPWAGSVTAISIITNESRTAGSVTVDVTKNGTATGLQAVIDASNADHHSATQTILRDTFAAGDRLGVDYTTSTDWAPVTADFSVVITVESGGN